MTFVEQYEASPYEVQNLVESYTLNLGWADDCFNTLLSVCPKKECSIRALAEAYAEWYHNQKLAEEKLKALGYSDASIFQLSAGYYEKYNEE